MTTSRGDLVLADLDRAFLSDPFRLEAVRRLRLSNASRPVLDALAGLIARLVGAEHAQISILGTEQVVPGGHGIELRRPTPTSESICAVTMSFHGPLVIEDTTTHPWVQELAPVMTGQVGAYAGYPLETTSGHLVGAICAFDDAPRTWRHDTAALLADVAALVMLEIDAAATIDSQQSLIDDLGRTVQRLVLPPPLVDVAGLDLSAHYEGATKGLKAGGDWYDNFLIDDHRLAVAVGDVSGHGAQAVATMAQMRAALRAYTLDGHDPGAVVDKLSHLLGSIDPDRTASLVYGEIDRERGTFTFSLAGHPPPLVASSNEVAYIPIHPAPPLNSFTPHAPTEVVTVKLGWDATLLLYSDGLVERRDTPLGESLERLRECATRSWTPTISAATFVDRLLSGMASSSATDDDRCVMAVRLTSA